MSPSIKPSKQRLQIYRAPPHLRRKFMCAKLSEELREKLGVKRLYVRTGDVVRVLRGDWRGHEGKVVKVDYEEIALHIEGVTIKKADGTPVYYPVHPSKVMIIKLDLSDKKRSKMVERKGGKPEEVKKEEVKAESGGSANKQPNQSEGGEVNG
ncbi:MAG: 50S ribosomal protein L24 [Zestosphaera sp.]